MEFSIRTLAPEKARTGCLVLGVFQDRTLTRAAQRADRAAAGALERVLAQGDLSGKTGSTLLLRQLPGLAAERVLLVGLGERGEFGETAYRDALRAAGAALKELGAAQATLFLADLRVGRRSLAWNVRQTVLALRDAFYRFDQLKTRKKAPEPALSEVVLALPGRR